MNKDKKLQNKVVLVTGAGKGIGRAVAASCAKEGARLILLSRSSSDLTSLQRQLEDMTDVFVRAGDVSDESFVGNTVDDAVKTLSRIDCLVNNAGVLTPRSLLPDVRAEDWDLTMQVNLRGPFLLMKHVLPGMMSARSGSVINVTSGAGKRAAPEWGPYAVSKFGIEGLTLLAAAEMEPFGVRVNAANPGGVRTRMRAMAYPDEDPATLPTPDDVAEMFVWLASDEAKGVTGESIEFREWRRDRG